MKFNIGDYVYSIVNGGKDYKSMLGKIVDCTKNKGEIEYKVQINFLGNSEIAYFKDNDLKSIKDI